jgi:hypothetical protein
MRMAEYMSREAAFNAITDLAGKAPTRSAYEAVWKSARALKKIPAADVAPIEALEHLRDELCAQDLITLEGLRKLNTLIWKYTTVHDGGADHEAD